MSEFDTGITKAEYERLFHLTEECSEVIKACMKICRHGWESKDPTNPNHPGNRADLERELADVTAAVLKMDVAKDIILNSILYQAQSKHGKNDYMHYQE